MKADVDQVKCKGYGTCVQLCPSVFRFQEGSKKAAVSVANVPADAESQCLKAAEKCPERAIIISR